MDRTTVAGGALIVGLVASGYVIGIGHQILGTLLTIVIVFVVGLS